MKRKFLTALVVAGGLLLTACQEDETMDELIQDTESEAIMNSGGGGGTNGDQGDGDSRPGNN